MLAVQQLVKCLGCVWHVGLNCFFNEKVILFLLILTIMESPIMFSCNDTSQKNTFLLKRLCRQLECALLTRMASASVSGSHFTHQLLLHDLLTVQRTTQQAQNDFTASHNSEFGFTGLCCSAVHFKNVLKTTPKIKQMM